MPNFLFVAAMVHYIFIYLLFIAIKWKAKYRICTAAMLLFYISKITLTDVYLCKIFHYKKF